MANQSRIIAALQRLPDLTMLQQYMEEQPETILERAFPAAEPLFRNVNPESGEHGPEALSPAGFQASTLRQSAELIDAGTQAVEKVRRDGADANLTRTEVAGLEAIVLLVGRPAILIQDGQFFSPPRGWEVLERYRAQIEPLFRSVGRIELTGHPSRDWVGTGFLVADDVVMSNRHVAVEFCRQGLRRKWVFEQGVTASINYAEELSSMQPAEFMLTDIIGIHNSVDLALFRVENISRQGARSAAPLVIAAEPPVDLWGRAVYIVGFPAWDGHRNDPDEMRRIFSNIFNIKRLQPGTITSVDTTRPVLTHDCSTLGGNSGSCLVDLESNKVMGLHFSGRYLQSNYAVALWQLRTDPLIRKVKAHFV